MVEFLSELCVQSGWMADVKVVNQSSLSEKQ